MKLLKQTRLSSGKQLGNCFPTVIACFLDMDNPEEVYQIQEHYEKDYYPELLHAYLFGKGYIFQDIEGHLFNGEFYLVAGKSPRGISHICIYQNGNLYHDPHPENNGLQSEDGFYILEKIKQ